MIKVKIDGLKVADYWYPADGWNYDALDSLAKELCDRYREAETELTVELFKKYMEEQVGWMIRPFVYRNMKTSKRMFVDALAFQTIEKILTSDLDKMTALNETRKELKSTALHRYLITPFSKLPYHFLKNIEFVPFFAFTDD